MHMSQRKLCMSGALAIAEGKRYCTTISPYMISLHIALSYGSLQLQFACLKHFHCGFAELLVIQEQHHDLHDHLCQITFTAGGFG